MPAVTERLEETLEREAPQWGIRPVPAALRRLRALDLAVLWGDLSIGLLVLVSGALLVPALGLPRALLAIVVGSLVGCLPLALVGLAGAREGVPGMVLFRPVLGRRGSYLPSAINLVQLVGWTAFEFWAMGRVANAVGGDLLGLEAPVVWLAVVAVVCTALAMAGPIFAVRRWLERFGAWVVAAAALWITVRVLAVGDLGAIWRAPGSRRAPVLARRRPGDRDAGVVAAARRRLQPVRAEPARRVRGDVLVLRGRQRVVLHARGAAGARRGRGRRRARHRHDDRGDGGRGGRAARAARGRERPGDGEHLLERRLDPERAARGAAAPADRRGGHRRVHDRARDRRTTRSARSSRSCS